MLTQHITHDRQRRLVHQCLLEYRVASEKLARHERLPEWPSVGVYAIRLDIEIERAIIDQRLERPLKQLLDERGRANYLRRQDGVAVDLKVANI